MEVVRNGERELETYLHIRASHPQRMYRRLYARLCTRCIDDDVCSSSKVAFFLHVRRIFLRADLLASEGMGRCELERKL